MALAQLPTEFFKKNSLPILRQVQVAECGHVCIAMICNYHGHAIDLFSLRQILEPAITGATILDLNHILEKLHFNTRAIRVDLDELREVQTPAIIHWNMNHFVVLKSVHANYAIIHDPAHGRRKVFFHELSKAFTGIVLEIEKAQDFTPTQSIQALSLRHLFKGIKGLKGSLLVVLILSLAIELFVLISPLFIQYITDNVVGSSSMNNLYTVAAGFILLTILHAGTEYMRSNFVLYLSNTMTNYFSSGVLQHVLKLPLSYFEQRHQGDILSRFHAINEIQSKITTDSINALLDGLVIVLALVIMAIVNVKLTCLVLLSLFGYLLLRIISYRHLKNQNEISIGVHAQLNSKFLEIIQSIMPIKLYAKESTMYREWKNFFINGMNANSKITKVTIVYNTASILLFNIENIIVLTLGALSVIANQHSIGLLVAFLAYRQTLVTKATAFMQKVFEYKLMGIQIDRVSDILLQATEGEEKTSRIKSTVQGAITVQDLSYHYPCARQFVLEGVNFHIDKGEKVVITGASGIGKTTLLKIMLGLIAPTHGKILIDGMPLDVLGVKKYRRICASVMQDDTLISGSILDNITFMDNSITIDKVYQAAKTAQIHEDILRMTMGYETTIGDMGSALSGGQKQRLLLARALYKNPTVLFLDEATSHLDVATEMKINHALKAMQITQVVIAHREESIKMADRVITIGSVICDV